MPPWSARLPPKNANSSNTSNTSNPSNPSRTSPFEDSLHQRPQLPFGSASNPIVPTLYPPPRQNSNLTSTQPRNIPRHGRSLSHPFPSFFGGSKKSNKHLRSNYDGGDFDSTDDDTIEAGSPLQSSPPKAVQGKVPKAQDPNFTAGKCITCNSTVLWPKILQTFRCQVCLTINDLKPMETSPPKDDADKDAETKSSGKPLPTYPLGDKVQPLSVVETRSIINKCITSYVRWHQEKRVNPSLVNLSPAPSMSPSLSELGINLSTSNSLQAIPTYSSAHSGEASNYRLDTASSGNRQEDVTPAIYSSSSPSTTSTASERMQMNRSENKTASNLDALLSVHRKDVTLISNKENTEQPNNHSPPFEKGGPMAKTSQAPTRLIRESRDKIFKPLENLIITSFNSYDCINNSFTTSQQGMPPRATSDENSRPSKKNLGSRHANGMNVVGTAFPNLDAKTLLLGDFAENGSWWTGSRHNQKQHTAASHKRDKSADAKRAKFDLVSIKTPKIDWEELNEWYSLVTKAGKSWRRQFSELYEVDSDTNGTHSNYGHVSEEAARDIDYEMNNALVHLQKTLLKATEMLLKRPGRPLKTPEDVRFLLILLANPLLYTSDSTATRQTRSPSRHERTDDPNVLIHPSRTPSQSVKGGPGQHSRIIKRILGLLANLSNECHHYLVSWFSRFPEDQFQQLVELVGGFVTYRLTRQHGRSKGAQPDPTAGLVPSFTGLAASSPAQLYAAIGHTRLEKTGGSASQRVIYDEDWQIKAAAQVMSLLFAANNNISARKAISANEIVPEGGLVSAELAACQRAYSYGQILPTSTFYNTLLDYSDLIADFEAWESGKGKFSFCQYAFFLSIWAKIHILEHDARRQMEVKAREAFFDSIMRKKLVSQYLVLRVRRDCLVEDSLRGVSEVVGSGQQEIKKGLRIEFRGEEGVDAGGLRKEWFLLLVRDIFDPDHGMFVYDEESNYCYFNPHCFETSDQFFLVGVLFGLAIYNSTILDVALPPFAFKKLLSNAPAPSVKTLPATIRAPITFNLDDLAEFRPSLARGLRQLLDFDGPVEDVFCRNFVADVKRYGQITQVALCPNGANRPVTNGNRREFVDLYVQYLLDTQVARQFEPFKRGFYTVCGGNALSLFRPEEIELLVRGSDEPLDVLSLKAVAAYENWGRPTTDLAETEPVLKWFWSFFERLAPGDQRKLLGFITGSDRIPAMGATNLVIKLSCLGEDCERFPVARTCFNALGLWKYATRQKLEQRLWRAVVDSSGFGLK